MEKYVFPSFLSLGELNNWIDRKRRRRRRSREEKITKRVSKTRTKGLAGKDSGSSERWRGREQRGRVSSNITFHLVENLFLDGNKRERCPAGLIPPSFRSWSRGREPIGLVLMRAIPTATKRISSTRPALGFSFLGLSFRRVFYRFSIQSAEFSRYEEIRMISCDERRKRASSIPSLRILNFKITL